MLSRQQNAVQAQGADKPVVEKPSPAKPEATSSNPPEDGTEPKVAVNSRPTFKLAAPEHGKDKTAKYRLQLKASDAAEDPDAPASKTKRADRAAADDVPTDALPGAGLPVDAQPPAAVAPPDAAQAAALATTQAAAQADAGSAPALGDATSADKGVGESELGRSARKLRADTTPRPTLGATDTAQGAQEARSSRHDDVRAAPDATAASAWQAVAEHAALPASSEKKTALPGIEGV
ncbi:MAG TPA: hypothetical protein VE029_10465, partial [Rhizobacter sp.]|nr:hypothetical protein [Rhizobacter sp.]